MRSLWLGLLLAFWTVAGSEAAVTVNITTLSITNQVDYLIASDTNRNGIGTRALVRWSNDGTTSANATTEYQLRVLLGTNPISIQTESGKPGNIYRFTNSVSVPSLLLGGTLNRTNFFFLRPAEQLQPFSSYSVELTLLSRGTELDSDATARQRFWHFTNTVSSDTAFNVVGELTGADWEKSFAIDTVPGQEEFQVSVPFHLLRYDNFDGARTVDGVPLRLEWQLKDEDGVTYATEPASTNFVMQLFDFASTTPRTPYDTSTSRIIAFRPSEQLDSVNHRYKVVVSLSIFEKPGGPARPANSENTTTNRAPHFNGTLLFGDVAATITNLSGTVTLPLTLPGTSYLNTSLDGRAVFTEATPDRSFLLDGPRTFRLHPDGSASLGSGSITFGLVDFVTNGNVRIRRSSITLTPNGATTDMRFYLPTGFGVSTNYGDYRALRSFVDFADVALNSELEPRANLVLNGPLVAGTETKPILINADRLEWLVSNNTFRLVPIDGQSIFPSRALEYTLLKNLSNSLVSPTMALKRANDAYYLSMRRIRNNVTISANSDRVAQLSFIGEFDAGSFSPHFPTGPSISFTNGAIQVAANSVLPGANSRLEGVTSVRQDYTSSCVGCGAEQTTESLTMGPADRQLNFTRDGGLAAGRQPGPVGVQSLRWGFSPDANAFAHRANSLTDLTFLMSGHFLRGIDNTGSDQDAAGVLHLTGFVATNLTSIERPLTGKYQTNGLADYAGMNLRSPVGSAPAIDTIAGTPVGFSRTTRAKYYARMSGINGIHEATPGTFDNTLTLSGYPFTFDTYGFSFLDSNVLESRTDGSVSVPYPANFTLPFEELKLTCAGGLGPATLPSSVGYRYLDYWRADILPQSLRFETKPADGCDPTESYLVLGVTAHASYVASGLSGTMGFFPNGSIIPPKFGLPGVDSRFELPSQFRFAGPQGSGDWVLTPVAPAYFTTNEIANATNGWLSIAGTMNVPFFDSVKVHLHTGARTNGTFETPPTIRLAGGWPKAEQANVNGWEISGKSYFTHANFDDSNRGFPSGIKIQDYTSSDNDQYRALVERTVMDIVTLKYPLDWEPNLRYFRSDGVTSPLFVVSATHRVSYLDPQRAVIDIGERYDGLPVVTLAHLLVDDNTAGAATAMRNAISADAFDEIKNGLVMGDALLSENPSALVDGLLESEVDDILDDLMAEMVVKWATAKAAGGSTRANFETTAKNLILGYFKGEGPEAVTDSVRNRLRYLGIKNLGGGLYTNVADRIEVVADGIARNANSFNATAGAPAIRNLVGVAASQFAASVAGPEVEAALSENSSAFQQLSGMMMSARAGMTSATTGMKNGSSEWANELANAWSANAGDLVQLSLNAADELVLDLDNINWAIDDPFAGNGSANFKASMHAAVRDRLVGQPAINFLRTSIKQRLFELNESYRSAANSVFAQYNFIARDLVSRSLASVDNNFTLGIGTLAQFFAVSRLQGHAEIQDDSLRELRLDGRVKIQVPEDMAFNAFIEIKEQNSENTPEGCLPPPGVAGTEIKFGATDVELDWISPDLRADVRTKLNLTNGVPTGFAGSFETRGPLSLAGLTITQVGFALAFGKEENYIAANARVRIGRSSEIAGGIFLGRACDIDPLTLAVVSVSPVLLAHINPHEIFGNPPFTGGFIYGEGMFPVFSVGCVFEVRLIAGAGGWYFKEGPKFGGLIKAGISGTAICVLSVSGDITLIGSRDERGMTFAGMAHVEGCFGIWPLEFCVDANTAVKYREGKEWDAEEP